jgi:hypothetical protein
MVTAYQFMNVADVRHQCGESATILQFVMKLCFFCLRFFSMSYALSNSTHIYISFTIQFEQMFINASRLLIFSNQNLLSLLIVSTVC